MVECEICKSNTKKAVCKIRVNGKYMFLHKSCCKQFIKDGTLAKSHVYKVFEEREKRVVSKSKLTKFNKSKFKVETISSDEESSDSSINDINIVKELILSQSSTNSERIFEVTVCQSVEEECKEFIIFGNKCPHHLLSEDNLAIKKSSISGMGLFAGDRDIEKGSRICEYEGDLVPPNEKGLYMLNINSKANVDARRSTNVGGYANTLTLEDKKNFSYNAHYVSPTREYKAYIKAIKRIKAGEEIFIPYGNSYKISS
jgi:hypothetical protein